MSATYEKSRRRDRSRSRSRGRRNRNDDCSHGRDRDNGEDSKRARHNRGSGRKSSHRDRSLSPRRRRDVDDVNSARPSSSGGGSSSHRADPPISSRPAPLPASSLPPVSAPSKPSLTKDYQQLVLEDESASQLAKPFVWEKKEKRDRRRGTADLQDAVDPGQFREELDLLARRRVEREEERRLREEERQYAQREADRAQFGDWQAREDEFALRQARARAEVRVREGRSLPVDVLAATLLIVQDPSLLDRGVYVDSTPPYRLVANLSAPELKRLLGDIEMYMWLEQDQDHQRFWKRLHAIAEHTAARARGEHDRDHRVAPAVWRRIENMLAGKSRTDLAALEIQIRGKLDGNEIIDVEYWEAMLEAVDVAAARAELDEFHRQLLDIQADHRARKRAERAIARARGEAVAAEEAVEHRVSVPGGDGTADALFGVSTGATADGLEETAAASSSTSKADLTPEQLECETPTQSAADAAAFAAKEVAAAEQQYKWASRYAPRKPKYVNRVNTGYEWNKYNQIHYDTDNPPPKVVQGYKFNIFYPDLIDRTKAPNYRIEPKSDGTKDTVILRFMAGAPYEDVAFEIVNKEWEMSHRRGFRCVFDRGVLQLHFQFRRFFYRK
ncbi:cactus-binding C-terminus of cactin protein-domain-containing protein [Blastocladiella britannica]|nr:cactus-binding C-terminus of cactin protein-domain-containing protein [Blastocladiella britannica]